ncbi:odorant receptor 131-2-like [Corythoichthys intestinalis]|uniref:odorant receptor 131-2-like n=1 Tax=Corythoichthys intestinalis TaxID=161448 RepID=UPI0025A5D85E|nr:odorant receptor 131-2-like [Corythoichthys intestinalis]
MSGATLANSSAVVLYRDSLGKAVVKNVIVLVIGLSINYINVGLMYTFCKHHIFYLNPRYILFFHLVVNDMIQMSATIFLFVFSFTLYRISVRMCASFILMAVITSENTPLNLACMAAECYVAVCLPLRHARFCTVRRTLLLIAAIWATSFFSTFPDLFVTLATEPAEFFSTKILFTARSASKDTRKARGTIVLHGVQVLLCMTMYALPLVREALFRWFPKNYSDSLFACYIVVQILPRAISPIIYGVRDKCFRKYLKNYLICRK